MTINQIARTIPAEYRREILTLDMVANAVAVGSNPSMYYLFNVWKTHVEPHHDLSLQCGICLERILKFYRALVPVLTDMERLTQLHNAEPE